MPPKKAATSSHVEEQNESTREPAGQQQVCELLQGFIAEQRSKDELVHREMARREQRWRSLQHQFRLLQEVQKSQLTVSFDSTRSKEQSMQPQGRILRTSQMAMASQRQWQEERPTAQMVWQAPRMPTLNETDAIEHFLTTFERLAQAAQWPVESWKQESIMSSSQRQPL
ncbi:hypothetical protein MHYP_G00096780 [Metynnis hypsauchen]